MTQLNSPILTKWQRKYLPITFSLILIGVFGAMLLPPVAPWEALVLTLVILILAAAAYFAIYRALVQPVADSVVLDGDLVRVNRGRQQASIPVASIAAIRGITFMSPETVTLDLTTECELGRSITFIPPARFPSAHEHPIVGPLREKLLKC